MGTDGQSFCAKAEMTILNEMSGQRLSARLNTAAVLLPERRSLAQNSIVRGMFPESESRIGAALLMVALAPGPGLDGVLA
jgi:hypothetical protein